MSEITKKELEHLATLARIDLHAHEEEKLLRDLGKILDHFSELEEVPTDDVKPLSGGTSLTNSFRDDEQARALPRDAAREAFPEIEKGFLKIPRYFE